ncbi:MAG: hypothetical protein ACOYOU_15480 [Kiritimatiellia bacterium]
MHGLFLKLHNLSNRQDAKVAKANKFDVFACEETTSGKPGVLGVLAVNNAAYVVLQEKTMAGCANSSHDGARTPYGVATNGLDPATNRL